MPIKQTIGDKMIETNEQTTQQRWDNVTHFIAQTIINIDEGINTIEVGSASYLALLDLIKLANEKKIGIIER